MFDPELVKDSGLEPEPKRHLGHTKAGFGAKKNKRGYFLDGEAVNQTPPNRRFRRAQLALAPRSIRLLVRAQKHRRPWGAWAIFPQEERERLLKLDAQDPERKGAVRYVKNMLKRVRQGRAK